MQRTRFIAVLVLLAGLLLISSFLTSETPVEAQGGPNEVYPAPGTMFVYQSRTAGGWDIHITSFTEVDQNQPPGALGRVVDLNLTTTPQFNDQYPTFSPDGRMVVFSSSRFNNQFDLAYYRIHPETLNPDTGFMQSDPITRLLAWPNSQEIHASFSPSGRYLAFASNRTGRYHIYFLYMDNPQRIETITTGAGECLWPRWSPDETYLAFSCTVNDQTDIYYMRAFEGPPRRLDKLTGQGAEADGTTTGRNTEPTWAPDSHTIVFVSDRGGPRQIYARALPLAVPDSQVVRYSVGLGEYNPVYSPLGNFYAWIGPDEVATTTNATIIRFIPLSIEQPPEYLETTLAQNTEEYYIDIYQPPPPVDTDNDGVADFADNCPYDYNPQQVDWDLNHIGDACDSPTPTPEPHLCPNNVMVSLDAPQSSLPDGGQVHCRATRYEDLGLVPYAPFGYSYAYPDPNGYFDFFALDAGGAPTTLSGPITVCFRRAAVSGTQTVASYGQLPPRWEILSSTERPDPRWGAVVCASTTHLSGLTLLTTDGAAVPGEILTTVQPTNTLDPDVPTFTPDGTLTPLATATGAVSQCSVTTNFLLRMRSEPNTVSATLAEIPYLTPLTAVGRVQDSSWWLVLYNGQMGWIASEFTASDPSCQQLGITSPAAIATGTAEAIALTPTAIPNIGPNQCAVVTKYIMEIRRDPSNDAPGMYFVLSDTTLPAIARLGNSTWWVVQYNGIQGWINNFGVEAAPNCDFLPVIDPETEIVYTITPSPEGQQPQEPSAATTEAPAAPPVQPGVTQCVVTTNFLLRLRAEPNTTSASLAEIDPFVALTAIGRVDDNSWWRVTFGNITGWVAAEFTSPQPICAQLPVQSADSVATSAPPAPTAPPAPQTTQCTVTASFTVRLRSAPNTGASVLADVDYLTPMTAVGRLADNSWWNVNFNAINGWVAAEFTAAQASCYGLPVITP